MKQQDNMSKIVQLTVLFAGIISSLAEFVIDEPTYGGEHKTILPGGAKLCSRSGSTREKSLTLNETAYIFINNTVSLRFESSCFRKKYFMKFKRDKWYNEVNPSSILQIGFTTEDLKIETIDVVNYLKSDLYKINSAIRNDADCLKKSNILNLTILNEIINNWFIDDNSSWFMNKCGLVFERKNKILCSTRSYFPTSYDKSCITYQGSTFFSNIVIKPIDKVVKIKTQLCNEKYFETEFIQSDFLYPEEINEIWFKFDYDIKRSSAKSSLIIFIAGIPVDQINFDNACYEEPTFTFAGVYNNNNMIKSICMIQSTWDELNFTKEIDFSNVTNFLEEYYSVTRYNTSRTGYGVSFPYIIILLMILVCKSICGYAIYKRRQGRLNVIRSRRLVEDLRNVHLGISTIVVAANGSDYPRQPTIQSDLTTQPPDLPPAYNELQHPVDINPPGYEDACKSHSMGPPGDENSCSDNLGFHIEEEANSANKFQE